MAKDHRETSHKGMGEFVGLQEDCGGNARFDWDY